MVQEPKWTIRRAEPHDAEGMARLFSEPEVYHNTLQDPMPSVERWRQRLAEPTGLQNLVVLQDADLIATGGIYPNTRLRNRHCGYLGMAVAKAWQGRGVGTDLLRTLLDHADNWQALLRVELQVFTDNAHAVALYKKFGFEIEGTLRQHALRDGAYVDGYIMARLHPRWMR